MSLFKIFTISNKSKSIYISFILLIYLLILLFYLLSSRCLLKFGFYLLLSLLFSLYSTCFLFSPFAFLLLSSFFLLRASFLPEFFPLVLHYYYPIGDKTECIWQSGISLSKLRYYTILQCGFPSPKFLQLLFIAL